jgi:3-dehydroquinate synthase
MRPGLIVFSTPMTHRPIPVTFHHRVAFTHGAFDPKNLTLRDLVAEACDLDGSAKVLVLLDSGVAAADPKLAGRISQYFAVHTDTLNLVTDPILLTGGEACKNDWSLVEKIWKAIEYFKICRHSYVIAIGGGAFLDLAGFGAATAHRGIRLIRMPTTTLSQGDGGVGVKNGVNYFGKKNWIGTFSVPFAVVNDLDFLSVLPPRACRDGIIEAIKVALIRDRAFYDFLLANGSALGRLEKKPLELAIRRSAENHVDHIATSGDPFEYGSARPLDFGHWVAHKLEQISHFAVSHGEAVALGMAVDLIYSVKIGLLPRRTAEEILDLIETVGFSLWSPELDREEFGRPVILTGLEEFREHLGGRLTITLVPGIGEKLEVHEMDENAILAAMRELRHRAERQKKVGR